MIKKVENLIIECLKELNEEIENDSLINPTLETKLYGQDGTLDSLALVSLVTDVEEKVAEELEEEIVLADEKAMSQRNSPFNSVGTLSKYIVSIINKEI